MAAQQVVKGGVGLLFGYGVFVSGTRWDPFAPKETNDPDVRTSFPACVGGTPMVRINSLSNLTKCEIWGKAEWMNPGGSVKDRPATYLIKSALENNQLSPGSGEVVEATAGNTGVGLAHVAKAHNLKCRFFVPCSIAQEKIDYLEALGAVVVKAPLVPGSDPMHFQAQAKRYAEETPGAHYINQFDNLANAAAHYDTTGPEIWGQTNGQLDAFVCAAGTGGTIAGVSRFLKERNPNVKVFHSDPPGSMVFPIGEKETPAGPMLKFGKKPPEEVQWDRDNNRTKNTLEGVGGGRLYKNTDSAWVDGNYSPALEPVYMMTRYLMEKEGMFVGMTGALNVMSAYWVAKKLGPGHTIATVLPDGGARYMKNAYNDEWLKENNLPTAAEYEERMKQDQEQGRLLHWAEAPKLVMLDDIRRAQSTAAPKTD